MQIQVNSSPLSRYTCLHNVGANTIGRVQNTIRRFVLMIVPEVIHILVHNFFYFFPFTSHTLQLSAGFNWLQLLSRQEIILILVFQVRTCPVLRFLSHHISACRFTFDVLRQKKKMHQSSRVRSASSRQHRDFKASAVRGLDRQTENNCRKHSLQFKRYRKDIQDLSDRRCDI